MAITRRRGSWAAVDVTAAQTVRNVLAAAFTSAKTTGPPVAMPVTLLISRLCPPYAAVIPII
jgi:hypothetical protein